MTYNNTEILDMFSCKSTYLALQKCTTVRKNLNTVIKRVIICFRLFLKEQFNVLPTHLFFSLRILYLQENFIFFYSELETQNMYIRSDKKQPLVTFLSYHLQHSAQELKTLHLFSILGGLQELKVLQTFSFLKKWPYTGWKVLNNTKVGQLSIDVVLGPSLSCACSVWINFGKTVCWKAMQSHI